MFDNPLKEMQTFLESEIRELNVVVMPDFFLDRFITLNWDVVAFSEAVESATEKKGGSIDGIEQADMRGGNAINTVSALAKLDVNVIPIVCTSKFGLKLIKSYLKSKKVDFSHIKIFKEPSITTALEFRVGGGRANVMLRDVGALADFGPHHLDNGDFKTIENADYVCVFNWAGTKQFGTELARTVFSHVKARGKGKNYYDTADPSPNEEKIPELMKNVLQSKHVDILSLNENEAVCYASLLSDEIMELKKRKLRLDELAKESARILATRLSARVDLHTTTFSATYTKKDETIVPVFKVPVLRATGAGDVWNAGNILGDAYGLSCEDRLALANAVAAYYISSPNGTHPSWKQLIEFCMKVKPSFA
ncbi:MAG: carbohydrate kinase family protein [Candidatus Bathyarchaeota archaeon]|nr:carbohydrate kinase family protein [Candidatus Bathyarchaeota archaeon]